MPFDGNPSVYLDDDLLQVLIKARGLIEQGWCKGSLVRIVADQPQYCVIGAIRAANGTPYKLGKGENYIQDLVPRRGIITWNDAPSRRKEHVLALFDRAIEKRQNELMK